MLAHRLLVIDDKEVNRKAARDFDRHCDLLSRTYFVPIKIDLVAGKGFSPTFRSRCHIRDDNVYKCGRGRQDLVFVCENRKSGFAPFMVDSSRGTWPCVVPVRLLKERPCYTSCPPSRKVAPKMASWRLRMRRASSEHGRWLRRREAQALEVLDGSHPN